LVQAHPGWEDARPNVLFNDFAYLVRARPLIQKFSPSDRG